MRGGFVGLRDSLATAYLCWLSKPTFDRTLYRFVKRTRATSIVEIGLHSIDRSLRMIRMAQRYVGNASDVRFSAIDLFDARPTTQAQLTLKDAHRQLVATGATVRLIPGDAKSGLTHSANNLQDSHVVLISADIESEQMTSAWTYLPRMLAVGAGVFQTTRVEAGDHHDRISLAHIQQRIPGRETRRKAA